MVGFGPAEFVSIQRREQCLACPKLHRTVVSLPATGFAHTAAHDKQRRSNRAPERQLPTALEDKLNAIHTRDSQLHAAAATLRQMIMSFRVTQMIHVAAKLQ